MGPLEQGKIKAVRQWWNARCPYKWEIGLASEEMDAKGAPYDVTQPPVSFLMGKVTLLFARHKRGKGAITVTSATSVVV